MMDAIYNAVVTVNTYLSNYVLLILLIGTGLFFTIRTKAIQLRCFPEGWRRLFGNFSLRGGKHGGSMSSFQALATAIAAQVGTGNIVGACGALLIGGPGAIFWMAPSMAARSTTSARPSRVALASSSLASSPSPSSSPSASWAAWFSPTPSPPR